MAGVTGIKNPITAARAVMEATPHVLLAGKGAELFAAEQGIELVDPSHFFTQRRWDALERAREAERVEVREAEPEKENPKGSGGAFGTVGALALDREGVLTAGTSTGGMTNKRHGRVGDSPIIGAGTYANEHCAASGTGHRDWASFSIIESNSRPRIPTSSSRARFSRADESSVRPMSTA